MSAECSMETVPPGYKQTEVGVIPEDWEVTTVGQIAEVKTGPFGSALHEKDYVDDGTPIITVEHLGERGVLHTNLPMVSDADKLRLNAYSLRQGDIVFSRVGSVDRNALIKVAESEWLFSGRLLRVRLKQKDIYAPYLSFHFHSETFKQRVRDVAVGQTMASINTQILMGIRIALPPTKTEQESIAEALYDADAFIESLEQLIVKKRQIKKGAMQDLLTGKRRLPGFAIKTGYKHTEIGLIPEDWLLLPVSALGDTKRGAGSQFIRYLNSGGVRLIRINDFFQNNPVYVEATENIMRFALDYRDLLFAGTGASAGASYLPRKEWIGLPHSYNAPRIRVSKSHNKHFLLYALQSIYLLNQQRALFVGAAQPFLDTKAISNFLIAIPHTKDEQNAIATILSDMDSEIAALEEKLAKARQIKQGMMQELLTGRIRLI